MLESLGMPSVNGADIHMECGGNAVPRGVVNVTVPENHSLVNVGMSDLHDLYRDLEELESICSAADDTYDEKNEEYNDALEELKAQFDALSIEWLKEVISEDGTLYQLVTFDTDSKANDILQEEFTSEAYDENLEIYVQRSMDMASGIYSSLHDAFSEEADDFLAEIEKILSALSAAIHFTDEWKASKINPDIDNT